MGIQQGSVLSMGLVAAAAGLFLTSCATPKVVESVQPADAQLACPQLQSQFDEAEKLRVAAIPSTRSINHRRSASTCSTSSLILSN